MNCFRFSLVPQNLTVNVRLNDAILPEPLPGAGSAPQPAASGGAFRYARIAAYFIYLFNGCSLPKSPTFILPVPEDKLLFVLFLSPRLAVRQIPISLQQTKCGSGGTLIYKQESDFII
jgi:hypothetical protein